MGLAASHLALFGILMSGSYCNDYPSIVDSTSYEGASCEGNFVVLSRHNCLVELVSICFNLDVMFFFRV